VTKRLASIRNGLAIAFLLGFPVAEGHGQDALSALPKAVDAPADNPSSAEKVALGKLLFWDPILSGNKDVACATCHHPRFGYADDRDLPIGVNGIGLGPSRRFASSNAGPFVKRNSPSLLNVGFNGIDESGHYDPATAPMFWDMRVTSLETQALQPIKTSEEMRGNAYPEDKALNAVVARLNAIPEYRARFRKAFGEDNAVNAANVGKGIATFERTLVANNSPFDRYMRGDRNALTDEQIAGMQVFERVGCANCHSGPMFSDYRPHVLGVPDNPELAESDRGMADEPYAFRTPSLRNLGFTAPYMHDGVFDTLREVIRFYRRPPRNPNVTRGEVDPLVRRLGRVRRNAGEIIAFLEALNDDSFDKSVPSRVPSGLSPGGRIQ
jgi:cytochrome c peroxidase